MLTNIVTSSPFFLIMAKLNNDTAKLSLLNKEYTESAVCYFSELLF